MRLAVCATLPSLTGNLDDMLHVSPLYVEAFADFTLSEVVRETLSEAPVKAEDCANFFTLIRTIDKTFRVLEPLEQAKTLAQLGINHRWSPLVFLYSVLSIYERDKTLCVQALGPSPFSQTTIFRLPF